MPIHDEISFIENLIEPGRSDGGLLFKFLSFSFLFIFYNSGV